MENDAAMLRQFLDQQRNAVFVIVHGLPDAALRQPVFPSGWSCLGLVQHLAVDDERYWFRTVAAGEDLTEPSDGAAEDADDAWVVPPDLAAEAVFSLYRDEIRRANSILEATSLDDRPLGQHLHLWSSWPPPDGTIPNIRWIVLHMIEETARHAGHLDTARELLDGRTGLG
jgi:uncharacterized protein DUF664